MTFIILGIGAGIAYGLSLIPDRSTDGTVATNTVGYEF